MVEERIKKKFTSDSEDEAVWSVSLLEESKKRRGTREKECRRRISSLESVNENQPN